MCVGVEITTLTLICFNFHPFPNLIHFLPYIQTIAHSKNFLSVLNKCTILTFFEIILVFCSRLFHTLAYAYDLLMHTKKRESCPFHTHTHTHLLQVEKFLAFVCTSLSLILVKPEVKEFFLSSVRALKIDFCLHCDFSHSSSSSFFASTFLRGR